MRAENRGQMVRGVAAISFNRSGSICFDKEDAEKRGNVIAYTPWHRHDEDLEVVEKELSKITRVYASFDNCDGMMFRFEYKDYEK